MGNILKIASDNLPRAEGARGGGEDLVQVALRRLQEGHRLRPVARLRAGLHHVQPGRQG